MEYNGDDTLTADELAESADEEQATDGTPLMEQLYREKKKDLLEQLEQLRLGTHPRYVAEKNALEEALHQRLLENECACKRELELAQREYEREIREADEEFERERELLMATLEAESERCREQYKHEFTHTSLRSGDVGDSESCSLPRPKRRGAIDPKPQAQRNSHGRKVSYTLPEQDIADDLQAMLGYDGPSKSLDLSPSSCAVVVCGEARDLPTEPNVSTEAPEASLPQVP